MTLSKQRASALRSRAVARIQRRLAWPRLQMMLVVALTGATGFLSSFLLLRAGFDALGPRYMLSVAIAYGAFLTLLWGWLRLRHWDVSNVPDLTDFRSVSEIEIGGDGSMWLGGGRSGGGGASGVFEHGPGFAPLEAKALPIVVEGRSDLARAGASSVLDADEIAAPLIALVAIAGAIVAAALIVWTAPVLLAELTLDAAVSSGLYRRLRRVSGDHWLQTAIRRTALPFAGVALLFGVAGALIHYVAPEATSMGDVFRR
jgi:hypothetical protein